MSPLVDPRDLERFQARVRAVFGLEPPPEHQALWAALLHNRLAATGCASAAAYLGERLDRPEEVQALAEALTVGETYFYRVPDQWRAFAEVVLPELARLASPGRPLRLLSAGCASGEEAYTMAMLVRERLPAALWPHVEIVGIDVNERFLAKARRGRYSPWSLRGLPEAVQRQHFRSVGNHYELASDLRAMVRFEARNLLAPDSGFWRPGAFDAIVCRNVTIYFAPEATRALIARFESSLAPGGYLLLGPAESLRGMSEGFTLHQSHQAFYYRRRGPVGAMEPPSAAGAGPTWMDAIDQASRRIASLRVTTGPTAPAAPPGPSIEQARALFGEERFSACLAMLAALPPHETAPPAMALLVAAATLQAGDAKGALAACERLLAVEPDNADVHHILALCAERGGDLDRARELDEAAVRLDARFAMPHVHLGLMARRRGDAAAATAALTRAWALLADEDAERLRLFGGGFGREALRAVCRPAAATSGGAN